MNKPKHTSGPWKHRKKEGSVEIIGNYTDRNFVRIAELSNHIDNMDEANAQLIAAVPDLFKALQEIVADMQVMSHEYQEGVKPFSCENAEKLIAKIVYEHPEFFEKTIKAKGE
jgi:hypothetical protein